MMIDKLSQILDEHANVINRRTMNNYPNIKELYFWDKKHDHRDYSRKMFGGKNESVLNSGNFKEIYSIV